MKNILVRFKLKENAISVFVCLSIFFIHHPPPQPPPATVLSGRHRAAVSSPFRPIAIL
jgi:hypothetical protein